MYKCDNLLNKEGEEKSVTNDPGLEPQIPGPVLRLSQFILLKPSEI